MTWVEVLAFVGWFELALTSILARDLGSLGLIIPSPLFIVQTLVLVYEFRCCTLCAVQQCASLLHVMPQFVRVKTIVLRMEDERTVRALQFVLQTVRTPQEIFHAQSDSKCNGVDEISIEAF